MKAIFPVATLVLLTASSAVTAADHKRSATRGENIGLASGFIAGALLGGPPGALIGAAIGTHYGGTIERAHKVPALEDELDTAEDELSAAMARAADLRVAVGDAEQELAAMNREVARLVTERTLLAGLNVEVLYMTGEAEPGSDAEQRLEALADVLLGMPGLSVQLDGYADQRGSERFNALLSEARARGIEQRLIAAGIAPERIRVNAFGEQQAQADDADGFALERRVTIRLIDTEDAAVVESRSASTHPSP